MPQAPARDLREGHEESPRRQGVARRRSSASSGPGSTRTSVRRSSNTSSHCDPVRTRGPSADVRDASRPPRRKSPAGRGKRYRRYLARVSDVILDKDRRPVRRGQHPKQHGCVRAEFTVEADVPDDLKVGIFREPVPTPPGSATRTGLRTTTGLATSTAWRSSSWTWTGRRSWTTSCNERTHDFVLMDHPVFSIGTRGATGHSAT